MNLTHALLLSALAGAAIPVGAALAQAERLLPHWLETELRHGVMAFGGGALMSAVALVLVPEGSERLPIGAALVCFLAGGLGFFLLDRVLERSGGSLAQLVAMLSDFVPEAIALGAAIANANPAAPLLAGLIALQNLPEGFNAEREMADRTGSQGDTGGGSPSPLGRLGLFVLLVPLGPLAAWLGHRFLAEQPEILGGLMLFAGGGILYLIFQDIAPDARLERRGGPALGAVLGFLLGLAGYLLVGHG